MVQATQQRRKTPTVLSEVTPHTHSRPAPKSPQRTLAPFCLFSLSIQPPLRHPLIRVCKVVGIPVDQPLETVDPRVGWDTFDAGEGNGTVFRCDARQGRTVRAHAEGFFKHSRKVRECIERSRGREDIVLHIGENSRAGQWLRDGEELSAEAALGRRICGYVVEGIAEDKAYITLASTLTRASLKKGLHTQNFPGSS